MTNVLGRRATRAGCALGRGIAAGVLLLSATADAQDTQTVKEPKPYNPPPIFMEEKPLEITLTGPIRQLRRDRKGTTPYRAGTVAYAGDSGTVTLPVRLRTRGIWRRANCEIPPLLMNFTKDSTKKTTFARLDRLRLSLHCRDTDDYEQYVLQDYQLYRVQRLLTPLSYDVRLVRVTYIDSEKKDTVTTRWAFVQEQDDIFAERVGAKLVTTKGAGPADLDPYESAFLGVFQYFVGNSDFSIRELHNIVLVYRNDIHIPVARDFDWSGAVNPRYAKPNPILPIKTVTQRIMRGYCAPQTEYERVFALFKEKKAAIYALYSDAIGSLIKPNVVKSTLEYFDDFYQTIDNPKSAQRNIINACLGGAA